MSYNPDEARDDRGRWTAEELRAEAARHGNNAIGNDLRARADAMEKQHNVIHNVLESSIGDVHSFSVWKKEANSGLYNEWSQRRVDSLPEVPAGYSSHNLVGIATFAPTEDDGVYKVEMVEVSKKWQRNGIATSLYDAARDSGLDVVPSRMQTPAAKAFWKNRNK